MSEHLIPEELSQALGCAPTRQQRKGQTFTSQSSGNTRIARFGLWMLEAKDREPEDLNAQIDEILGKLSDSLDVWRAISQEHEIDLFCGFFMQKSNEGVELSAESLAALSERGIQLSLDIYSPSIDELSEEYVSD